MMISVTTNVNTAHQCLSSQWGLGLDFENTAIQGGSVMVSLVSLGVLALFVLIELSKLMFDGRKVRRRPWIFGQEAPVAICHSRTRMGDENTVVNLTTQVLGDTRC